MLQHILRPTAFNVELPWTVPPALKESGAFLSELCGCAPVSEYPALHILAALGADVAGYPLPAGLAGPRAWDQATPRTRELDIGHLPWPGIILAVFSAAADKFLGPSEFTTPFSRTMLELILERSGTLNEQDFVDKLADFGSRPPAQRVLYMQGLTTAALGKLTRPGAWLLDYVYTVISVIYGDAKPSVLFTPVPNATHLELLELCFPHAAQSDHGCSRNNRGNQMEAMSWLEFEADHSELVLAQAFHSRRRARLAQLAEAGATDAHDEAGQASTQMQALIQYGQQLGYTFQPPDPSVHATRHGSAHEPRLPPHGPHLSDAATSFPRSSPPYPPPGAFASVSARPYSIPRPAWHSGEHH